MSIAKYFTILFVIPFHFQHFNAYRLFEIDETDTILALENEEVQITCKTFTEMPMAYCGFVGPSGTRYSFSGLDLANGKCFIKINVTKAVQGVWQCHIGPTKSGIEIQQKINVRVVGYLAALQPNVTGVHRKPITLMCTTTKELRPLSYCRFEPPNDKPFSINAGVSINNAIQNRYYFPPNKSLDRGDCGVTIRKVKYEDVGLWTCGAGFDDGKEHIDFIKFEVEGLYSMTTASVTGMAVGISGVIVLLIVVGVVAWNKRSVLGSRGAEPEVIQIQEMAQQPRGQSVSPHRSPLSIRAVPSVVVESPSEPSMSPLIS